MKNQASGRQQRSISRRSFLGTAAAAGAFTLVPRHVLGGSGQVPPSERLNIAGIGAGGRGSANLTALSDEKQNIVALCDTDWRNAAGTFRRFANAKQYKDFRKMLDEEEKNIDAVVVSTADHCHAVASMAAIKRGKHVYCEKPLTHNVYEARVLAEAARQYKVATQMGNNGQAGEERRLIAENIWAGAIGAVREVHIWTDRPNNGIFGEYWPQGVDRPADTPPVPDWIDWDTWLGPAPVRPYHPAYTPFKWRGWWDFGTGALGDIGCHSFDPAVRALKLGAPISVEACSTRVNKETYPLGSIVTYHFPARGEMPPVKLVWYDGGLKPARPEGMDPGWRMDTNGSLYIGDKGIMAGHVVMPKARRDEFGKAPQVLPRSPGHYKEWINACKGGEPARSNFDHAGPMTETVLLGNVALRMELRERLFREALLWDSEKMQFTNVPEANQYLRREYRKGWSL
ncbi:MAG TPA: Gfo/Idh/MocA family oxidoreductase [Anaerohalosphaeraceae bacterium]|jgi:predicted dehydrogenase|nr:Gfo/Idh/MocA family oxidoreductase [Anaerohalosphaeraceae bacterium]HRT49800.1 Gfo/Idh/MocA family oxidoreductase [Anaerohalosphaeraceae bacterium]HRT85540.1 Gfo/Idh/MocA family oxidoreductase [Anaerohalosphaeraceae bacterium]